MESYKKINPKYKSAMMIAKTFRMYTGEEMVPEFVHWLAKKKGFTKHFYGREVYYASNLQTEVYTSYAKEYPIFLKEKEEKKKKAEEKKNKNIPPYDPNRWIEPDRSPRFYDESIIRKAVKATINEIIKRTHKN